MNGLSVRFRSIGLHTPRIGRQRSEKDESTEKHDDDRGWLGLSLHLFRLHPLH